MAITFQGSLDLQPNVATGTNVPFTVSSNANRFLIVSVMRRAGSTISVTYSGVSMTQIGTIGGHVNAGDTEYLFGLIGPSAGANNIVVTHNGTGCWLTAAEYNGVDQTTGFETANTAGSSSAAAQSVTVTPTKSDWIVGGAWENTNFTADGNTTLRTTTNNSAIFDSNANKTTAYAIGYSDSASGDLVACGLIDVSQSTTTARHPLITMGIGS